MSELRQRLDREITTVMYGSGEKHEPKPEPVVAKAPSKPHPRSEPKAVVRIVTEGPRSIARPLAIRVRPESAVVPAAVRTTEYPSNSNVAVGVVDPPMATLPPGEAPMRVQVSPRESLYMLLKQVSPVYPPAARAAGKQGAVVLKAVIGKDGLVKTLESISGDPILVPAALDAVRKWQYRPYYRDGEPQEVETLVVLEFSLAQERAETHIIR